MKVLVGGSLAAAFVLSYFFAPMFTVIALMGAMQTADAEGLSRQVDFANLRSSLKEQLSAAMFTEPGMSGNPFAISLGPGFVNGMVERFVTPSALAAMLSGAAGRQQR